MRPGSSAPLSILSSDIASITLPVARRERPRVGVHRSQLLPRFCRPSRSLHSFRIPGLSVSALVYDLKEGEMNVGSYLSIFPQRSNPVLQDHFLPLPPQDPVSGTPTCQNLERGLDEVPSKLLVG